MKWISYNIFLNFPLFRIHGSGRTVLRLYYSATLLRFQSVCLYGQSVHSSRLIHALEILGPVLSTRLGVPIRILMVNVLS